MQNAHLRMGRLEYVKAPTNPKSVATHIVLPMDRAIVEPANENGSSARCHLLSVFGGDQEMAAVAAAISEDGRFRISGPDLPSTTVAPGERATVFRSSFMAPGRRQPIKHLVALSEEFSQTQAGADPGATRTVLYDSEPEFMLYRLGVRFGLPVIPEWSAWVAHELKRRELIVDLPGLSCCPVLLKASKTLLLEIVSAGLKSRRITIPDEAAMIHWNVRQSISA